MGIRDGYNVNFAASLRNLTVGFHTFNIGVIKLSTALAHILLSFLSSLVRFFSRPRLSESLEQASAEAMM